MSCLQYGIFTIIIIGAVAGAAAIFIYFFLVRFYSSPPHQWANVNAQNKNVYIIYPCTVLCV